MAPRRPACWANSASTKTLMREVSVPLRAQVVRLSAVLGQSVRTGDALATLQSGDLARARSEIATATSRVNLARQTFERRKASTPSASCRHARCRRPRANCSPQKRSPRPRGPLLLALTGQDDSPGNANEFTLRAPLGGVIVERAAVLGQVVDPEKPIFKIANLSTVWLTVHARTRRRATAAKARRRALHCRHSRQTFQGTVSFIGRTVESESRTVPVRIDLPNAEGRLRPGMSATAWLPVGNEQGTARSAGGGACACATAGVSSHPRTRAASRSVRSAAAATSPEKSRLSRVCEPERWSSSMARSC